MKTELKKLFSKTFPWRWDFSVKIPAEIEEKVKLPLIEETLTIRRMKRRDVERVYSLEQGIFSSPWSRESFAQELTKSEKALLLVAILNDVVIGYSVSWIILDEIHIANLAVDPRYRRRKIGESILKVNLELARKGGCKRAHLEVRRSNEAAIALYRKFGFQVKGIRKGYYADKNEDALLMTRILQK